MPRELERLRRTKQFSLNEKRFPHVVEIAWNEERMTPAYVSRCKVARSWANERFGPPSYYFRGAVPESGVWTEIETVFMFKDHHHAFEFSLQWR